MRAIIVEDNQLMMEVFMEMTSDIDDLYVKGMFQNAEDAIAFSKDNFFEIAFLDIELPGGGKWGRMRQEAERKNAGVADCLYLCSR